MTAKQMRANPNLLLREIAGEHLLIPVGEIAMTVHGMIRLTNSGLLLWNRLKDFCTEEDLVQCILSEYDIDQVTAEADVKEFVSKMDRVGILLYE